MRDYLDVRKDEEGSGAERRQANHKGAEGRQKRMDRRDRRDATRMRSVYEGVRKRGG